MLDNSLIVRKYNFSDGNLALFANTLVLAMTRDLTEFEAYGVTALKIGDLSDIIDEFQALPNDEIYLADYSYAIEQRDELRFNIENVIRSISVRAKSVFGTNSAKYRSLKPGNISQMSESEFLIEAKNIHNSALSNLVALTPEGITALYLTTLNTNIDSFETSLSTVADKKIIRDDASENKVLKGNELYSLVVKYCDYGKTIWNNVSPAKYNDYIIYNSTSPGTLTAPANLQYDQISGIISWNPVDNATSYKVEISYESGAFEEIYADVNTETYYIPPNSPSTFVIHAMARNANGLGPIAPLTVNYNPPVQPPDYLSLSITNPTLHTIGINWGESFGATSYRLYKSSVPLGSPAGEFLMVGEYGVTSYNGTVAAGLRHYFYVVAVKGTETSIPSEVSYLDM